MAEKEQDATTRKLKKITIWATAIVVGFAALGVTFKGVVSGAEKVLFAVSLPEQLKSINRKTSTILDIVCEYHPSDKCHN